MSIPGRPFIRPTRTVSFSCPAASVESSNGSPASTAVCTASPRSRARARVLLLARRRAEPSRRCVNPRGEREHPELELSRARAISARVGASMDGEPPPPVALVTRHARTDRDPQLARELLRELPRRVQALPRPGMQGVHVDPPEQLVTAAHRQDRRAQIALEPATELRDQPDRAEHEHRHQLPAVARPERRHDAHADRPLHGAHAAELLAGERQPGVRADPPAAQVRGVELVGVGQARPPARARGRSRGAR